MSYCIIMEKSDLANKVIQVVSDTLGIPASNIDSGFSRLSHPDWDSMKHVELVIALETKFGFRLQGEEVGRMNSFDQIHSLIQTKLSSS